MGRPLNERRLQKWNWNRPPRYLTCPCLRRRNGGRASALDRRRSRAALAGAGGFAGLVVSHVFVALLVQPIGTLVGPGIITLSLVVGTVLGARNSIHR